MDQHQILTYVQQAIAQERNRIADAIRQTINMRVSESAIFQEYGDDYQEHGRMLRDTLTALERNIRNP